MLSSRLRNSSLLSTAGLVLLIACASLANLMLACARTRDCRTPGLRVSRPRLISRLLSEGVLLAFLGAALGSVLARVLSRFLVLFMSRSSETLFLQLSPDWRLLGFTAALAVLTCILFGLTPALMAALSSFFGFLAITLATVGLCGVIAYMVTHRRSNRIRMALGADRPTVIGMVIREAAMLLLPGLLIGTVLALFAAHAVGSFLFGLKAWDPASLAIAIVALASITLIASYLPALHAARLDPMIALREE